VECAHFCSGFHLQPFGWIPSCSNSQIAGSGDRYIEVFSGLVLDNLFLVLVPSSYIQKMRFFFLKGSKKYVYIHAEESELMQCEKGDSMTNNQKIILFVSVVSLLLM